MLQGMNVNETLNGLHENDWDSQRKNKIKYKLKIHLNSKFLCKIYVTD